MTPRDFANLCASEKLSLLNAYFDVTTETAVGALIRDLSLTSSQSAIMRQVIDSVLTDAMYGLLLGLDGTASIGGTQQPYRLIDEVGNLLTGGKLEAEAWQAFHGSAYPVASVAPSTAPAATMARMDEKPRRRWWQFRLRTLLVAVVVLSIPLAWIGYSLNWIRERNIAIAKQDFWLRSMFGGDLSGYQEWIRLHSNASAPGGLWLQTA